MVLFAWYASANHHLPIPWLRTGILSVLTGLVTGAALGGGVQLLVGASQRVRGIARVIANPATAGALGGALASVLGGVMAVVVFGANRGPYVGTLESAAMLIAACASLATLLTADAMRGGGIPRIADLGPALVRVLIAAAIVSALAVAAAVAIVPSVFEIGVFWTARAAIAAHGQVTVGVIVGVLVGAVFGMHLGLSIWLGTRARRS